MAMKSDKSLRASSEAPITLMIMNLKHQLRYYLELKEMSAAQLAKKAGVPKQSLSGWLSGSNPRDVRQIKRVADALGISVDNLIFGTGNDNDRQKITELDALMGDGWISGLFEVRFRRVKK
jgi:transcriptional regulator with XRE-family HTH domain